MHSYEIEIKVLLWNRENRNAFFDAVTLRFPEIRKVSHEAQKNHYFEWGNILSLLTLFRSYLSEEKYAKFEKLAREGKSFSVRTRGMETHTILVVKATLNDETSENGTQRIEWEGDLFPMTLDTMDQLVLDAGYIYQAKWSREREEYALDDRTTLDLDKNAWYGYLAEFERVIDDETKIADTREEILDIIHSLWYDELPQDRLARMFDFYNKHWNEYYGTEKVFTVL